MQSIFLNYDPALFTEMMLSKGHWGPGDGDGDVALLCSLLTLITIYPSVTWNRSLFLLTQGSHQEAFTFGKNLSHVLTHEFWMQNVQIQNEELLS